MMGNEPIEGEPCQELQVDRIYKEFLNMWDEHGISEEEKFPKRPFKNSAVFSKYLLKQTHGLRSDRLRIEDKQRHCLVYEKDKFRRAFISYLPINDYLKTAVTSVTFPLSICNDGTIFCDGKADVPQQMTLLSHENNQSNQTDETVMTDVTDEMSGVVKAVLSEFSGSKIVAKKNGGCDNE